MRIPAAARAGLILSTWLLTAACVDSQDKNHQTGIRKIVLKGTTGEFTLKEYMCPGDELRIRFNQNSVDASNVKSLAPASQLFVQTSKDRLNPHATALHPAVIDVEKDDELDFKTKALWSRLIGQRVTLEVNEQGLSAQLKANLALAVQERSRFRVSGSFLGYGKAEGEDHNKLKLLAGKDRKLVEIPENAIVSFDFHGALSREMDRALELLRAKHGFSARELIVVRVDCDDAPPDPVVPPNSTIVFTHTVTQWQASLTGKLNKAGTKVTVTGWVQLKNDTPYDWRNVEVTLKKGNVEQQLNNVTLASEQTNRFPILFLDRTGHNPVASVELLAKRYLEVRAPDNDKVDPAQELAVLDTLSLENAGDHPIPAGTLIVSDHENKRLASATIAQLLPQEDDANEDKEEKGIRIELITDTGVVASYTRKEELVPVQVVGLNGYSLNYHEGRRSSFKFKSRNGRTGTARIVGNDMTLRLLDDAKLGEISVKVMAKKAPKGTKLLDPLKQHNDESALLIGQRSSASASKNVAELSASELTNIRNTCVMPTPLRGALSDVIGKQKEIKGIEDELAAIEAELELLEDRRTTYTSQAQSGYHAAILRRLAEQIQQKEKVVLAKRNELAIASYERDHFIRTLNVSDSSVSVEKQIRDLGGYTETDDGKVVTVMFGSGYPASHIRNKQLEVLADLDTLEHVSLRGCANIRDEGLEHLNKSQASLKSLVLHGASVSDASLAQLRTMTNLTLLNLKKTRVTDDGLPHLYGLSENLKFLDLTGTRVTKRGVDKLRAKLPNCAINFE